MMHTLNLGSLPKAGIPTLLIQRLIGIGRTLGGFMKLSGKTLNLRAVRNHTGLDTSALRWLDKLCAALDLRKSSVFLFISESGMRYDILEIKGALFRNRQAHGLTVVYSLSDDDYKTGPTLVVPWAMIKSGAPSTGHAVYAVNLFSYGRMSMMLQHGQLPMSDGDESHEGQPVPFDVKTKGRIPAYIGKTSQGIYKRLTQHLASAFRGSMTPFHRTMMGSDKYQGMLPTINLIDAAQNEEDAYSLEEDYIKASSLDPRIALMNVISSRDAIQTIRQEFPHLIQQVERSPEQADEILESRRSATSALWDDPDYAESVICNNERNFTALEVRQIRMLSAMGIPLPAIANSLDVRKDRIKAIVSGKTYRRIH